nr:hypothetical protein [Tanacetum cinerariifolium]
GPYALSWKPCQGDSLNLPDQRYKIYTVKCLVPAKSKSYYQAFNVKSLFREIDRELVIEENVRDLDIGGDC